MSWYRMQGRSMAVNTVVNIELPWYKECIKIMGVIKNRDWMSADWIDEEQ